MTAVQNNNNIDDDDDEDQPQQQPYHHRGNNNSGCGDCLRGMATCFGKCCNPKCCSNFCLEFVKIIIKVGYKLYHERRDARRQTTQVGEGGEANVNRQPR